MNVQPTPSADCMPTGRRATDAPFAVPQRSPTARLVVSWPIEFEVEPWRP